MGFGGRKPGGGKTGDQNLGVRKLGDQTFGIKGLGDWWIEGQALPTTGLRIADEQAREEKRNAGPEKAGAKKKESPGPCPRLSAPTPR